MTDLLETDLRAVLARHAASVTADAPAGEVAVAARLDAGDAGLAEVMALTDRTHRRRWLAAAAAIVLGGVAIGAGIAGQARDRQVDTSEERPDEALRGAFEAEGSPAGVAALYVMDRLGIEAPDLVVRQE
ncbi:MAG: hypothetical protein ABL966_02665, partial [Acidimicrobiales bacterium]